MGGKLRGEEQSIGKCRKEKFGPLFSMLDMDGDILYRMSVLSPECFFVLSFFTVVALIYAPKVLF